MPKPKASFRQRSEHALFRSLLWLIRRSPPRLLAGERRALTFFFEKASRRHSRRVSRNLEFAYPREPAGRRDELKRRIYRHFGAVFMELARTFASGDREAILRRCRIEHGERLQAALDRQRGVVVFSAHFGNWEWIPLLLRRLLRRPIHSIARPLDNPLIDAEVRAFREAIGSRIIYKQGSLRTILSLLACNEVVYLLIDQNTVEREGVFVDFFSRQAATITTVSQLHLKKGIPLLPVFLHYEGQEIVLEVLPEIAYAGDGDADPLVGLTQHLTGLIEEQVRRFPEQWLWFHDRWRTRPQGEQP